MPQLSEAQMRRSQHASVMDGSLWSVMVGAGENFLQAFAVKLGASAPAAVLVVAFPQFVAAFVQLLAVPLSNSIKSPKPWVAGGAALQRLLWLPLALLAWWASPYALAALVAIYCIYASLGALINPIWSSWMAEIVPENVRGSYFSHRNRMMILIAVASALAAGWLSNEYLAGYAANDPNFLFGMFYGAGEMGSFALLFSIALLAGMASAYFLTKMDDAPHGQGAGGKIGLAELFTNPAQKESRKFAMFIFFLMAATYIGSPFVAVYMLAGLNLDLFTFSLISVSASVAKYLTLPYWGKLSDRFGPRAVFITCGLLVPFVMVPWIIFTDPRALMAGEIYSGIAWGGFELACFNFVLGRAEKEHRTAAMAVYNLSKGSGLFIGSAVGIALWVFVLPSYAHVANAFALLFAISAAGRLLSSVVFLPKFTEGSFGGMGMGKFLWQALAVNPSIGVASRMTRTFSFGVAMFNTSVEYGGKAARGGLDLVIYAMKRGPVMIGKRIRLKKGL